MARLLHTYTYTCSIVSQQAARGARHHFPAAFFLAYRNWLLSSRGLSLQECSEAVLQEVVPGGDTCNVLVAHPRHAAEAGRYCRLVSLGSGASVVARLELSPRCPAGGLLASPATLRNLAQQFRQTPAQLRSSKYVVNVCENNYRPASAANVKIHGLHSKLLDSIPVDAMDEILGEYFDTDRYIFQDSVFCVDIPRYLTCSTAFVYPLLKENSSVHFKVDMPEEIVEESEAGDEEKREGYLISKSFTTLTQCKNLRIPYPPQSIMTNFHLDISEPPKCFARLLRDVEDIHRRYQRAVARSPGRPALRLTVSGGAGPGGGAELLCHALAAQLGFSANTVRARDLVGDTAGSSEALLRRLGTSQSGARHEAIIIQEVDVIVMDRERNFDERAFLALQETFNELNSDTLVMALCQDLDKLNPRLASLFLHHVELPSLDLEDRQQLLSWHAAKKAIKLDPGVDLCKWATLSSGFNFADLGYLLEFAADELGESEAAVDTPHLEAALAAVQAARSDSLGLASIPSVKWEDVGGLEEARQEILEAVSSPAGTIRRSGVLLYGPPGVGKTLLAKAVATETCHNFLSVKGPELLNMYVGQSEENVRTVFMRAREAQPCIVFFDELDSLAPARGQAGDSGGVMDRVVSSLLTQLDSLASTEVTVLAATNRPDLLDPALLRPGRFDRSVYLGVSRDPASKLTILAALTRKMQLASDCDLASISQRLPVGLTGADIASLVSEAAMVAIKRTVEHIEVNGSHDIEVRVTHCDFMEALEDLKPSVSEKELQSYEYLKQTLRK